MATSPNMLRLMKMLSEVTGWGESLRVTMAYTEVRRFIAEDETERTGVFTWAVSTTICGLDGRSADVQADDPDLELALVKLAKAVIDKHESAEHWHRSKRERAVVALQRYYVNPQNPHISGPYR